jgi:uncharacterized protein (TIGR02453 family)
MKPSAVPKSPAASPPAFSGFGPRALDFFKALAFHQDKAWFEENRSLYEAEVKAPLEVLLRDLTAAFATMGLPLQGNARSVFRLHRDIRFSKDKRPYKTNSGAVLSRDGTKRAQGFLYLHLDPEGCFAAAGFWRPEPDETLALRRAIAGKPAAFRDVVARLGTAGLVLGDGDPLARLPKGFEAVVEPDLADTIRMRNILVRRALPPPAIGSPNLVRDLVRFAGEAEPLLRFGWAALDAHRPA